MRPFNKKSPPKSKRTSNPTLESKQESSLSAKEKKMIKNFNSHLFALVVKEFALPIEAAMMEAARKEEALKDRVTQGSTPEEVALKKKALETIVIRESALKAAKFLGENRKALNDHAIKFLGDPYDGHASLKPAYSALSNFRQNKLSDALKDLSILGITDKDKIAEVLYDNRRQIKSDYMQQMLKAEDMQEVNKAYNALTDQDAIKVFHKTFSKPYENRKALKEQALQNTIQPLEITQLKEEIQRLDNAIGTVKSLNTVDSVATYLRTHEVLPEQKMKHLENLGEYLSDEHSVNVLDSFTRGITFSDKGFLEDLREFVAKIKVPGEAQRIERITDSFGKNYAANHPEIFKDDQDYSAQDKAGILGTATILLNTDLHNPNVRNKISMEGFIKQTEYIHLPREFIEKIYKDIKVNEFKFSSIETPAVSSQPPKKGIGVKLRDKLDKIALSATKFTSRLNPYKRGKANISGPHAGHSSNERGD